MSINEDYNQKNMADNTTEFQCELFDNVPANGARKSEAGVRQLIHHLKDQGVPHELCAGNVEYILGPQLEVSHKIERVVQLVDEAYSGRDLPEERTLFPSDQPRTLDSSTEEGERDENRA